MLAQALLAPAFGVVNRGHWPRLAHHHDLVATHRQYLPTDSGGIITQQKRRYGRHLLGLHRLHARQALLLSLGFTGQGADQTAPGKRRDAVGTHAKALHIQSNGFGQGRNAQLGSGIVGLAEVAHQTGGGSHMHIGTALLVFEKRRRRPADKERAVQMHIHYGAPLVLVHFVKNAITQNASVVDDAINAAKAVYCSLNHGCSAIARGYGMRVCHRLATSRFDLSHHGHGRPIITAITAAAGAQIVHHHLGAQLRQQQGGSAANAITSPRHQYYFVFHILSPCLNPP